MITRLPNSGEVNEVKYDFPGVWAVWEVVITEDHRTEVTIYKVDD